MPKITSEISTWFDYPDDPWGGRVHIRHLKEGELSSIRQRTSEIRTEYVQEFRQKEVSVRQTGLREAICIAAIKEWENFFDENDQQMKCTPGNIRIMCTEAGFFEFIDNCLDILEKEAAEKKETETKN